MLTSTISRSACRSLRSARIAACPTDSLEPSKRLIGSILTGLAVSGATAATSKAAETVGKTAAEVALGKDEEGGAKAAAKGPYKAIADVLHDAAKKIERLEEKSSMDSLIADLQKQHAAMGETIAALARKDLLHSDGDGNNEGGK